MAKRYQRLVIDTDIVRSAGGEYARDSRSIACRDFLKIVLSTDHVVVITEAVLEEWKRHRSNFTKTWLRSMFAHRKIDQIVVPANHQLRLKIEQAASSETKREAMLKDIHLIEAALQADKIVISMDGTARGYFQEVTQNIVVLRKIVWINP